MTKTGAFTLVCVSILSSCSRSIVSRTGTKVNVPSTAVAEMVRRQTVHAEEGTPWVQTLRQKVAAKPKNIEARTELAKHYELNGVPELAIEHYRAAVEIENGRVDAVASLARLLRDLDLRVEARKVLVAFESMHPGESSAVLTWLAMLDDDEGKLKDAEGHYRQALALEPNSDTLHNNLGYNLLSQGRSQEASVEFRAALELNPRSVIARNNLGASLASEPKEAVLHWQSVSDPATAHNNMAAILMEQGKYEEARRELAIALGYRKDHPVVLRNLRLLSEREGVPVTMNGVPDSRRWGKFEWFLKHVVAGIEEPKQGEPLETARK
jgi:Tfp pilus assembly protein PilF